MFFEIGKYGIDFVGLGIDLHIDEVTILATLAVVIALRVRKVILNKRRKF